jgi:four helix bundle protein
MERTFRKLNVWNEAMELVEEVYNKLLPMLPSMERFSLSSQSSRAVISIPANISEGSGRYSKKEFKQFLYNARGSLYELMTLLDIMARLKYISSDLQLRIENKLDRISGLLNGLINSLK